MYTPNNVGGYEYTFVESPPSFCICNICHHPSRDPYMTGKCCRGQTICRSCLDQWKEINGTARCPVCGTEFKDKSNTDDFKMNQNYLVEKIIKGLKIFCTNKQKGCKWQGELMNINNHLENSKGCEFEEVKCLNECGKIKSDEIYSVMLWLFVHVVRLTASTAMIKENINLLRVNTRRSVPSFPYHVPTNVRLGVFPVKIWRNIGKYVSWKL